MNKKKLLCVLGGLLVVLACALALLHGRAGGPQAEATAATKSSAAPPLPRTEPDEDVLVYGHLFGDVAQLREAGGGRRDLYKTAARLSGTQAAALERIALECQRELKRQDGRAFEIIKEFRRRLEQRGAAPEDAPPPAELAALQEGRNRIIRRAKERLAAALGAGEFARFDGFVRAAVKVSVERRAAPGLNPTAE